jgi:putative photosynthetic complex assembly protein
MNRLAGAQTMSASRDWRSRIAERYPLIGVVPTWLIVAVMLLPASGFWLGLQLKGSPPSATVVAEPAAQSAVAQPVLPSKTLDRRRLRFVDAADKSVLVLDADSGAEVYRVTGEAGFIRGILRGMARERRRLGKGAEEPFELARDNGLLTLRDLATGEGIELTAFGHTNAGAFARMLIEPQLATAAGGAR